MRHARTLILTLAMCALSAPALAQDTSVKWRTDTAYTAPAGRVEFGLFSPTRWAITDSVELQTDLLLNAVLPNLGAQVRWTNLGNWTLSTKHVVRYQTMLFSTLATEGTGGFIPANITPPQMIELDNEVRVSARHGAQILTFDLGVDFTPQLTEGVTPSGSLPVVDFPFLYQRLAAASGGVTLRAGAGFSGVLVGSLEFAADLDLFYNPAVFDGPVLEQGCELAWRAGDHFSVAAGWRITAAQYGYGPRAHIMPTLDLRGGF